MLLMEGCEKDVVVNFWVLEMDMWVGSRVIRNARKKVHWCISMHIEIYLCKHTWVCKGIPINALVWCCDTTPNIKNHPMGIDAHPTTPPDTSHSILRIILNARV